MQIRTWEACAAAATAVFCVALSRAQSQTDTKPAEEPTFDVASVKPATQPCPPSCGLVRPLPGNTTYIAQGATLRSMMTIAYSVTDRQITGGPAWINSDRFDVEAKSSRPHNIDELHAMLGRVLEERFQLKLRRENREETVYLLTVAKDGPKMKEHDPADKDHPPFGGQVTRDADGGICPVLMGTNVSMDYFAFYLSRGQDRKTVNRTNLTANYDLNLRYLPDGVSLELARKGPDGNSINIASDCKDLASALPKQLGLKVELGKGPVEYIVVEHAEKPSEN